MRHQTARETVTLHGALEPLTDRAASHVNLITLLEQLRRLDLRPDFVRRSVAQTELFEVSKRRRARLLAVPEFGLRELVVAHGVVADLHRVVPIRRLSLHLCFTNARESRYRQSLILSFAFRRSTPRPNASVRRARARASRR